MDFVTTIILNQSVQGMSVLYKRAQFHLFLMAVSGEPSITASYNLSVPIININTHTANAMYENATETCNSSTAVAHMKM